MLRGVVRTHRVRVRDALRRILQLLDALEGVLDQGAVSAQHVGDDEERDAQKRTDQQRRTEDERLNVVPGDPHQAQHEEPTKRYRRTDQEHHGQGQEDRVWFEHHIAAHDRLRGAPHVLEDVREQTRFARLRVGLDGNTRDTQALVSGLNDRLHAVAELSDDVQSDEGLARVRSEAARRVGQVGLGGEVHHTATHPLHDLFETREMRDRLGLPVPDDDVRLTSQDGLNQVGDSLLRVLVVAVGVDDNVRAVLEGVVDTVAERPGEAHVAGVEDEVLDPQLPCYLDGSVG